MNPQRIVHPIGKREVYLALGLILLIFCVTILIVNLHTYRPPSTFYIPAGILIMLVITTLVLVLIDVNRENRIE